MNQNSTIHTQSITTSICQNQRISSLNKKANSCDTCSEYHVINTYLLLVDFVSTSDRTKAEIGELLILKPGLVKKIGKFPLQHLQQQNDFEVNKSSVVNKCR